MKKNLMAVVGSSLRLIHIVRTRSITFVEAAVDYADDSWEEPTGTAFCTYLDMTERPED